MEPAWRDDSRTSSAKGAVGHAVRSCPQGMGALETSAADQEQPQRTEGTDTAAEPFQHLRRPFSFVPPQGSVYASQAGPRRCTDTKGRAVGSSSLGAISGPKYFFPPEKEYGNDEPAPSGASPPRVTCEVETMGKTTETSLRLASWNVAGTSSKNVQLVFDQLLDCDVVAVQEFPKQEVGWKTVEGDVFRGIVHQNHGMYRGGGDILQG